MLEKIIAYLRPPPQPTKAEHPPAIYREKAAYYLYLAVRPADGLDWRDLTEDQRARYRALIGLAVDMTQAPRRTGRSWELDANAEERVRR